jgi:uncharacterized protein YdbL (DUF1318 family)
MAQIKDREIFALGNWKPGSGGTINVTAEYVAKMIHSFTHLNSKVEGFAIPLKRGHNRIVGEPAYGYAENVRVSEDGQKVIADFNDVDPEIVDQITKKKYNTVSVEIWPKLEYAGQVFENVLSGVALLGAEWPAVKGLKPLSVFAEAGEPVILSQEEVADMKTFTADEHETLLAAAVTAATAALTTDLTAANQRADVAEAALASFADEADKNEINAIIEAAEAAGKIVPASKPGVVAMAEAVRLSVEPAKRKEAIATFKTFIEGLPKKVELGTEGGGSEQDPEASGEAASTRVDNAVRAAMAKDPKLTYRTATDVVFAADPALKTAYAEENR